MGTNANSKRLFLTKEYKKDLLMSFFVKSNGRCKELVEKKLATMPMLADVCIMASIAGRSSRYSR